LNEVIASSSILVGVVDTLVNDDDGSFMIPCKSRIKALSLVDSCKVATGGSDLPLSL
jgi:hypothetical protein